MTPQERAYSIGANTSGQQRGVLVYTTYTGNRFSLLVAYGLRNAKSAGRSGSVAVSINDKVLSQ